MTSSATLESQVLLIAETPSSKKPSPSKASSCAAGQAPASDRRISRSRKAMRRAFIELTSERGREGFTVNDLCERADINRGTVYNHFKDKDELDRALQEEFMRGLDEFRSNMQKMTLFDLAKLKISRKPLPILVDLFDYLREQSGYLSVMLGPNGNAEFKQMMQDTICADLIMGMLHEKYRKRPTAFVSYYVSFYSAAYLGVISKWFDGGMEESSEEMARIAMRLLFIKPGESIVL